MENTKRVRKKTAGELADPELRRRLNRQKEILQASLDACDVLAARRKKFIQDIANNPAISGRSRFLREARSPVELHYFSLYWNCDRGPGPIHKIVTHSHCDAGTVLRLYWLNDPYYYQKYRLIRDCPESERPWLRILRFIERRFLRNDFVTAKVPFNPEPWVKPRNADAKGAIHEIPEAMFEPIHSRKKVKRL